MDKIHEQTMNNKEGVSPENDEKKNAGSELDADTCAGLEYAWTETDSGAFRLKFDLHTHTIYSRNNHGKGTIQENVEAAIAKGLSIIGISDHGPGHVGYGLRRENISVMRAEIDRLQALHPEIQILLGVEANIINSSGRLDVREEEFPLFDYVAAGYHYGVFGDNLFKAAGIHGGNLLWDKTGKNTAGLKRRNTEIAVRAVYENKLKVLTHPGDKAPVYLEEIVRACEDRDTLMEVNNSHSFLSVEGIRLASRYDVSFIIGSDAHVPSRVGNFQNSLKRILAAGIDIERVVNLEKR